VALLALTLYPLGFAPLRQFPRAWDWTWPLGRHWPEIAANVICFLPLGIMARSAGIRPWVALLLGATLSLGIEQSQIWIRLRFPTYTDSCANIAGVALGALIARPLLRQRRRLLTPAACATFFAAGAVVAMSIAYRESRFLRFGWSFTFALAVVGSALARGFAAPLAAGTIAFAASMGIAAVQPHPIGWGTGLTCVAGALLGLWPGWRAWGRGEPDASAARAADSS